MSLNALIILMMIIIIAIIITNDNNNNSNNNVGKDVQKYKTMIDHLGRDTSVIT